MKLLSAVLAAMCRLSLFSLSPVPTHSSYSTLPISPLRKSRQSIELAEQDRAGVKNSLKKDTGSYRLWPRESGSAFVQCRDHLSVAVSSSRLLLCVALSWSSVLLRDPWLSLNLLLLNRCSSDMTQMNMTSLFGVQALFETLKTGSKCAV